MNSHTHNQLPAGSGHPLLIVRPFLDIPKSQLEDACEEAGLTWAVDPTNSNTMYLRNHLRALIATYPAPQHLAANNHPRNTSEQSQPTAHARAGTQHSECSATVLLRQHNAEGVSAPEHGKAAEVQAEPQQQRTLTLNSHISTPHQLQLSTAQLTLQEQQPRDTAAAVLQVQQRCAAAHEVISAKAKCLLQASLQQHLTPKPAEAAASHANELSCCLAVQPFAQAQPTVALHALSATLQVSSTYYWKHNNTV